MLVHGDSFLVMALMKAINRSTLGAMSKSDKADRARRSWNDKYASAPDGLFGNKPNEYLRMVVSRSDFNARRVLALGDGDGRNGSWLAGQGFDVTAVDFSQIASDNARRRDMAGGVVPERIVADLAYWMPPPLSLFDAVIALYLHCEPDVRARAIGRAIAALSPGGWLVIEAFSKSDGVPSGPGLKDQALRYSLDECLEEACGMAVVEAFEGKTSLLEGPAHFGTAEVIRFAARRV